MKTILISTSNFEGAVADYYKNIGVYFLQHNYKVVYIYSGLFNNYPEESTNIKYYTWKNKPPTRFYDYIFLYKLLKKEKPCLCISNFESTRIVSIVSFIFGVKNRINYIHTTSKQHYLDYKTTNKLLNFFRKHRKKIRFYLLSINTHFFTNSTGTKSDAINSYNIPENKISILPLLIKSTNLKYKNFQDRENCICIVGRLDPSKGHKTLFCLFEKCLEKHPALKLKIVGDGYLKPELIELSKKLKIYDNLIFTGKIPYEKINEIFSSSIASISSSIDEAYGLNNIEALREGTPIICTRTAGSIDIIKEKENGLFINLNDEFSLCNALEAILKEWELYSNNALKTFHENYSMNNIETHFSKIKYFTN